MENQKNEKFYVNRKKGVITFWAIVLVVVAFFFLKNAGFLTSIYLSTFLSWPIILFCISIICLLKREWVGGIVLLATAKFFYLPILLRADPELCPCISADGFVQKYWYLLVIFIAIVIIIQQIFTKGNNTDNKWGGKKYGSNLHEMKDGFVKSEVIFGSNEKSYLNENFTGGIFNTVFGSQIIDLRKCIIQNQNNAIVDISLVFGSCTIWIPAEWTVKINTESVFSAIEDKRFPNQPNNENNLLIINGKCVFSRLEIRN